MGGHFFKILKFFFLFSNQTLPLLLKVGWERAIIYMRRVKPLSTNDVLGKDRDGMTFVSGC